MENDESTRWLKLACIAVWYLILARFLAIAMGHIGVDALDSLGFYVALIIPLVVVHAAIQWIGRSAGRDRRPRWTAMAPSVTGASGVALILACAALAGRLHALRLACSAAL